MIEIEGKWTDNRSIYIKLSYIKHNQLKKHLFQKIWIYMDVWLVRLGLYGPGRVDEVHFHVKLVQLSWRKDFMPCLPQFKHLGPNLLIHLEITKTIFSKSHWISKQCITRNERNMSYLFERLCEHIDDNLGELLCVRTTNILDNGIN